MLITRCIASGSFSGVEPGFAPSRKVRIASEEKRSGSRSTDAHVLEARHAPGLRLLRPVERRLVAERRVVRIRIVAHVGGEGLVMDRHGGPPPAHAIAAPRRRDSRLRRQPVVTRKRIAEHQPRQPLRRPDVHLRRERGRRVHAADGHVDEAGQERSRGTSAASRSGRRRRARRPATTRSSPVGPRRSAARALLEHRPRDGGRSRRATAHRAVAERHHHGFAGGLVADRATQTATLTLLGHRFTPSR